MVTESSGFFEHNMNLLKKYHVDAWQAVSDTDLNPVGQVIEADTGVKNLQVEIRDNDLLFFHDRKNPEKDGEDFLAIVPKNARGSVIFQGMGLGYGPITILENRHNIRHLIIFELCVEIFLQALRANDLSVLLSDPRVIFSLGKDPDVNNVLSSAVLAMRLEETSMLKHNPSYAYEKEGYEKLGREIYSIANALNISANTFKSFGTDFISNRLSFLKSIHHNSLIDSLRGRFRDVPALMVAAGPSLNKNIHLIKSFKGRAVIISADSALPALLAHDVTPDFVTSIDYKELTYEKIAACAPRAEGISLICSSWVAKKVARVFPADNIFWTFTGSAMEVWINKGLGGKIVYPGAGTVAHLNLVAAIVMGCSPIIFAGQDLAFSEKTGDQDHVAGAALKSNNQTSMLLKNRTDLIWVDGNSGKKVPTSRSFKNYLEQFESMIAATPGNYINATEGGAYIEGTESMPLKEVLDEFCTQEVDISEWMEKLNRENRLGDITPFLLKLVSLIKTVKEMKNLIKKADRDSKFLFKVLSKLNAGKSGKCVSFNDLPGKLQKTVQKLDKNHLKLDKEKWFWELFDEATMNALQETERMKHDIDKLQNTPEKYIEWLKKNLIRLDAVNLERKKLLDGFGRELSEIVEFHKKEDVLLKESGKNEIDDLQKLSSLRELALLYIESGNFVHAKKVCERVLIDEPENPEICFNLGKIAAMHTQYGASEQYFLKALNIQPDLKEKIEKFRSVFGDEYYGYAVFFWNFDRESAKKLILKGLRVCPDHNQLLSEISAILAKEMGEIDSDFEVRDMKAMEQWIEVFRTQPELEKRIKKDVVAEYYKNSGKFFQKSGLLLKSFEALHKALACSKENPEYYLLLSELMFEMGKETPGISYYEKAVYIDKEFVKKYEIDKEKKNNIKFRADSPDENMDFNQIGDEHFFKGKFEDAVICYNKALLIDKDDPDIIHKLGVAFKESGEVERAISCFNRVLAFTPENFNAYYNLGVALQSIEKIDEAISAYNKAVELNPDFLNALNNLGNAYNSQKKYSEAIRCYKKILEINPDYADALNNLGVVFQAMGDYDLAADYYKRFLQINPGNIQVIENLKRLMDSCPDQKTQSSNFGKMSDEYLERD